MTTRLIRRTLLILPVVLVMAAIVFLGGHAIGNPVDILIAPQADQPEQADTCGWTVRDRPAALPHDRGPRVQRLLVEPRDTRVRRSGLRQLGLAQHIFNPFGPLRCALLHKLQHLVRSVAAIGRDDRRRARRRSAP